MTSTEPHPSAPSSERDDPPVTRQRAVAIDVLRLLMSIQMIQGHAISALLRDTARSGALYEVWTFVRGLTAVGFLFAAGASYHLATSDPVKVARDPWRRVRRAVLLIAVGFALRPPVGLFSSDAAIRAHTWDDFLAVDVLQCIGATLLLLEGLLRVLPRARLASACVVLGALAFVAAPWTATWEAEPPLRWLLNWVSRGGGSFFPLLPWSGFLLFGVALGEWVARARSPRAAASLLGLGVSFALIGEGLTRVLPRGAPDDYYAWPPFTLIRLGLVAALLALLALATRRVAALPRWLEALAGQTLVLYVVHLVILHVAGIGLIAWLGPSLDPPAAVAVALVLTLVSTAAALGWAFRPGAARHRSASVTEAKAP